MLEVANGFIKVTKEEMVKDPVEIHILPNDLIICECVGVEKNINVIGRIGTIVTYILQMAKYIKQARNSIKHNF